MALCEFSSHRAPITSLRDLFTWRIDPFPNRKAMCTQGAAPFINVGHEQVVRCQKSGNGAVRLVNVDSRGVNGALRCVNRHRARGRWGIARVPLTQSPVYLPQGSVYQANGSV